MRVGRLLSMLGALSLCVMTFATDAATVTQVARWESIFKTHQANGVMVLWNEKTQLALTNNASLAEQGYIPASTFKIPNSLIALELGVVSDENQVFTWDGQTRWLAQWNQDLSFRTAMKYSAVPIYQQIAREIGTERMQSMVELLDYGNHKISPAVDTFWLEGDIRISPMQQVTFLRQLYHNQLPVSERSQRIVKQMMLTEANNQGIWRAKTGFSGAKQAVGWWVGWLETDDNVWFFALKLDINDDKLLPLRKTIAKEIIALEIQ